MIEGESAVAQGREEGDGALELGVGCARGPGDVEVVEHCCGCAGCGM